MSYAVVWFAQAVMLSLERARLSEPIRPIRRVESISVTVSKPEISELLVPMILAWINQEIPCALLAGKYDVLLQEFRDAHQIVLGRTRDKNQRRLNRQIDIRATERPDGSLDDVSEQILVALYSIEAEGEAAPIGLAIRFRIDVLLGKKLGSKPKCARGSVTGRLPGLKACELIQYERGQQPSLTSKGRSLVIELGLLEKYPKWKT